MEFFSEGDSDDFIIDQDEIDFLLTDDQKYLPKMLTSFRSISLNQRSICNLYGNCYRDNIYQKIIINKIIMNKELCKYLINDINKIILDYLFCVI